MRDSTARVDCLNEFLSLSWYTFFDAWVGCLNSYVKRPGRGAGLCATWFDLGQQFKLVLAQPHQRYILKA